MGYAHLAQNDKEFNTDLQKQVHKIISGMRYGEKVTIPLSIAETKEEMSLAIKKSVRYNCMDVRVKWPKSNDGEVTVTVE